MIAGRAQSAGVEENHPILPGDLGMVGMAVQHQADPPFFRLPHKGGEAVFHPVGVAVGHQNPYASLGELPLAFFPAKPVAVACHPKKRTPGVEVPDVFKLPVAVAQMEKKIRPPLV